MNDILTVVLTTLGSIAVLFLLTKLMGHKQVSQLTMYDYVVGITIGSIAAEMATELESPWRPLLAMALYGLIAVGISRLTNKSLRAQKMITGKPQVLLNNGKLYRDSFKAAKMDLSDFLSACRVGGYFDLNQLETVLLEPNGNLSFLPVVGNRPVTPADIRIQPPQEFLQTPVIMDGEVLKENLKRLGTDETWLRRSLEKQNIHHAGEVFLALCDHDMELTVFSMQA